jgi:hypothetical protein
VHREPLALITARELYARAEAGLPCTPEEIAEIQARLRAHAAHPSCGPELRTRIDGMLLVLGILSLAGSEPQLTVV